MSTWDTAKANDRTLQAPVKREDSVSFPLCRFAAQESTVLMSFPYFVRLRDLGFGLSQQSVFLEPSIQLPEYEFWGQFFTWDKLV